MFLCGEEPEVQKYEILPTVGSILIGKNGRGIRIGRTVCTWQEYQENYKEFIKEDYRPNEINGEYDINKHNPNSIVRRIHFSLTTSRSLNIFSIDSNEKYQQYEEYFDKEFERKVQLKHNIQFSSNTKKNHTISKGITKSSERKSVNNISLSTQESSYKKYFGSPLHH